MIELTLGLYEHKQTKIQFRAVGMRVNFTTKKVMVDLEHTSESDGLSKYGIGANQFKSYFSLIQGTETVWGPIDDLAHIRFNSE